MVASSLPQAKCTHLGKKIALLAPETPLQHPPLFQKLKVGLLNNGSIHIRIGKMWWALVSDAATPCSLASVRHWRYLFLFDEWKRISKTQNEDQLTLPAPRVSESDLIHDYTPMAPSIVWSTKQLLVLLLGPMVKPTPGRTATQPGCPPTRGVSTSVPDLSFPWHPHG